MKKEISLTKKQQVLVEEHLSVVHWTIRKHILVNESVCGMGYDDLFQEGCIWLCHAAVSYQSGQALFATYAKTVVRNGLISYCRQLCRKQNHFVRMTIGEHGELSTEDFIPESSDTFHSYFSVLETLDFLESLAPNYHGVAKLGIEALELKIKGMSVTEIAQLYHVPASHVGAWISRSAQKLRKDPNFLSGIL